MFGKLRLRPCSMSYELNAGFNCSPLWADILHSAKKEKDRAEIRLCPSCYSKDGCFFPPIWRASCGRILPASQGRRRAEPSWPVPAPGWWAGGGRC